jgi:hypothetical protein
MNIRLCLVALSFCLLVTACGKQWTRPGASSEQIAADVKACEQLAAEQFPVDMSSTDSSNRKEYETRCTNHGNQTNCTTRSSDVGASYQYDRNLEERGQAVTQCLEARGYVEQ